MYARAVPKLWNETIDAHRREVREAILDTAISLTAEHGLRSVTMSQIAEQTGIGRATLYKYFPDIEAILRAWHGRQIQAHLALLAEVRDQETDPLKRLEAVLAAYAHIVRESRGHPDPALTAFLHRDEHLAHARQHLHEMVSTLLGDAAAAGLVRDDVPPDELAHFCLHALTAAAAVTSDAAVDRLVAVTQAAVRG